MSKVTRKERTEKDTNNKKEFENKRIQIKDIAGEINTQMREYIEKKKIIKIGGKS